ncbi:hypothetical protein DFH09DRAFT_1280403 [Mycena vulgaris]|nr:hypothetical protein DFH09DRAFT_1280403 [Mycena vulgaris]
MLQPARIDEIPHHLHTERDSSFIGAQADEGYSMSRDAGTPRRGRAGMHCRGAGTMSRGDIQGRHHARRTESHRRAGECGGVVVRAACGAEPCELGGGGLASALAAARGFAIQGPRVRLSGCRRMRQTRRVFGVLDWSLRAR